MWWGLGLGGCVAGVVRLSQREVSEAYAEAAHWAQASSSARTPFGWTANGGRLSASAPLGPMFMGLSSPSPSSLSPEALQRELEEYSARWRAAIENPLYSSSSSSSSQRLPREGSAGGGGGSSIARAAAPRGEQERWVRRESEAVRVDLPPMPARPTLCPHSYHRWIRSVVFGMVAAF